MSSVRVRSVGKAYRRYERKSGRLQEWLGFGNRHELVWVLRDVSFEIQSGEAVGIIGANGAGKSTLLKILAGTIRPTTGAYEIGGRLSALLELGIGFHPDFTGRQNAIMAGHLHGFSSAQTAALMSEIQAFAEIGDYIDQPVRTYSTGMQVRLAFSVATATRPDVLIVDEALSVGDAYFQHKSFDRIRRFRDAGTTLLFVSHSPGAVKTLCNRALLLDRGLVLRDGSPDSVIDYYNALIAAHRADYEIRQSEALSGRTTTRSGSSEAMIESIELLRGDEPVRALRSGDSVTIRVSVLTRAPIGELSAGILIRDRLGNDVFGTNTYHLGTSRVHVAAAQNLIVDFDFPALDLGVGSYSITAALHAGASHTVANFDWWDRALVFQVVRGTRATAIGVCALDVAARWHGVVAEGSPESVGACAVTEAVTKGPQRDATLKSQ